ncbi:class I SAM-dependent methyltransferase [Streptomyces sp. NP160]|uniref:class I SAM-dependent methyltransferase n=1 Tax=Streptomyces sp. NP160 TaxID=2586637 RepID=UPI001119F8A9|nr:methyltransferase domain-containing protein [Streptomyces sp. NP160]TNM66978.1 class I SAM-dependent methyltransferase [Streptomyces sp. NP160]
MSHLADALRPGPPVFGEGCDEPYRRHLRSRRSGRLHLHRSSPPGDGGQRRETGTSWELDTLRAPADSADTSAIAGVEGPLLDVGCGPGRMVRAALHHGLEALGVDVAPEAAQACADRGARAVRGSVFDALPREGHWRTVLLMDGNLGIGGDPGALFARCADLLAPGGVLVVEADADEHADEDGWFVVVDDDGASSAPFRWARLGLRALRTALHRSGFEEVEVRRAGARCFVHAGWQR